MYKLIILPSIPRPPGTFTIPELSMIAIAWEVTHPNGFSSMVALRFNNIQRIQATTGGYNLGTRMYSTTLLLPKGLFFVVPANCPISYYDGCLYQQCNYAYSYMQL